MSYKMRLFSLSASHAVKESCIAEPYSIKRFVNDLIAGLTVGVIAIPLAMALAIASGVAPQYGLYSAFIAGFLIPLFGGSRFSISGPTAAFVVILYPVATHFGLGGLLVTTIFSGVILMFMAWFRLGRLIEYIPESVTFGFTGGIAMVIILLQMKDFFGLTTGTMPEENIGKFIELYHSFGTLHVSSMFVALSTLLVMIFWPKLKTRVPPHLPALACGLLVAFLFSSSGYTVATIGSKFSFAYPDGSIGHGIPPFFPSFEWPWLQPGPDGQPIVWTWNIIRSLLFASVGIAMLGAIESLLCAVVLEKMSGKPYSSNSELLGQGIGNIVAPFFGGITATAAIARSAANVRAGAESPVAGMIHAVVVLLGLVCLAPFLAYLPMPALAALLVMVAWNMSEAPKIVHLLKTAPRSDIVVFLACFLLTILFDMVIGITVGVLLASLLFMKEVAAMSKVVDITQDKKSIPSSLPEGWKAFKIKGPLFFAAADRIFSELSDKAEAFPGMVLCLEGVPVLDAGGASALHRLIEHCQGTKAQLYITDLQFQPLKTLAKANFEPLLGVVHYSSTLAQALEKIASESKGA